MIHPINIQDIPSDIVSGSNLKGRLANLAIEVGKTIDPVFGNPIQKYVDRKTKFYNDQRRPRVPTPVPESEPLSPPPSPTRMRTQSSRGRLENIREHIRINQVPSNDTNVSKPIKVASRFSRVRPTQVFQDSTIPSVSAISGIDGSGSQTMHNASFQSNQSQPIELPLVGVEPNPGPKSAAQKAKRAAKRASKKTKGPGLNQTSRKQVLREVQKEKKIIKSLTPRLRKTSRTLHQHSEVMQRYFTKHSDGLNEAYVFHNVSGHTDSFATRVEKVQNVIGQTGSAMKIAYSYYLNPGNTTMFLIFSQLAATYEFYTPRVFKIHYIPKMYKASGSVISPGSIAAAVDYNSADAGFTTIAQLEDQDNSISCVPFVPWTVDILRGDYKGKKDPMHRYYTYVSANSAAPNGDNSKFYEIGNLQIGLQNNPDSTSLLGELFVEYAFTMVRPRAPVPLNSQILQMHIQEAPAASASTGHIMGTTFGTIKPGSTLTSTLTDNNFTIPIEGTYLVVILCKDNAITTTCILNFGSNISVLNLQQDNTGAAFGSVSSNVAISMTTINVNAGGNTSANQVQLSGCTNYTGGKTDIWVVGVSSGITQSRYGLMSKARQLISTLDFKKDELDQLIYKLSNTSDEVKEDDSESIIYAEDIPNRYLDPRFVGKSPMEIASYFSSLDPKNCKLT